MMLVESYWGYAVLLLLALAEGEALTAARAALAGALLGLVLCASPVCVPAAALLAVLIARRRPSAASWRALAAGLGGWLVIFGLWCARYAELGLWYENVIRFNAFSYAYFSGVEPGRPSGLLLQAFLRAAAYFARTLAWTDLEQYFEGLLRLAALGTVVWHAWRRRFFEAGWWALFILALRLRAERFPHEPPIHGGPYFLCAAWLLSLGVVQVWERLSARAGPWSSLWLSVCAAALALSAAPTAVATGWLKAAKPSARGQDWLVGAIRSGTDPYDSILALPIHPRLYLETKRVPAAPAVFYLPWQAAWAPERERLARSLTVAAPKLICLERMTVWGVPWAQYAGEVDERIRTGYVELRPRRPEDSPEVEALYVRKDYAPEFLKRCSACVLTENRRPGVAAFGRR
jgi:hypothetical protein